MKNKNSPWLLIWTRPRMVIRKQIESDSQDMVLNLAMFGGIYSVLNRVASNGIGDHMSIPAILLYSFFGGILLGLLLYFSYSFLIKWIGGWLGGQGSYGDIKMAYAWSNVPLAFGLALWILQMAIFKKELFTSQTTTIDSSLILTSLYYLSSVTGIVLTVWSIVILIGGVAEAHKFSLLRGFISVFMSFLIVLGLVLLTFWI